MYYKFLVAKHTNADPKIYIVNHKIRWKSQLKWDRGVSCFKSIQKMNKFERTTRSHVKGNMDHSTTYHGIRAVHSLVLQCSSHGQLSPAGIYTRFQ